MGALEVIQNFINIATVGPIPNEGVVIFSISFILSYIIKLFVSPGKREARTIVNGLTFLIVFFLRLIQRYRKQHPKHLDTFIDKIYTNVFHTKHNVYTPKVKPKPKKKVMIG